MRIGHERFQARLVMGFAIFSVLRRSDQGRKHRFVEMVAVFDHNNLVLLFFDSVLSAVSQKLQVNPCPDEIGSIVVP
jgi:hypothetical protein